MKKFTRIVANLLTLFRICLVFVMLPFLFYIEKKQIKIESTSTFIKFFKDSRIWFSIIFLLASITDYLDGYIAKKFKKQSIFGKFFDPIADKLLVIISFLYIHLLCNKAVLFEDYQIEENIEYYVLGVLVLSIMRDFLIMGVRLIAFEQKKIIKSSFLGKLKTIFAFISIIFILLSNIIRQSFVETCSVNTIHMLIKSCLIINAVCIFISGLYYIIKHFKIIEKNFYNKQK
ncbi:CDP-alcohol phosphatidyltransferase family protein [Candidatus Phytoplasma pini]|uniref:CDP-diacylglycerol-glycerol-3-phosphate 3-phosphatidyltransferase n=1 Tax=Candidatus Phytoplasma pini TaxID=267362 RepID=A0A559KK19_9MOLU|nr:CDP-alcohol phosphatidyltransferase family protein [Candidatus Phytoplasma pini]TVY12470.1 CDP-diacylglycerol-glycerol-3-phosphate 3-phosphatidyltransferase [Candidatus Phytoplasma pini]